jgi:hypothetical protein
MSVVSEIGYRAAVAVANPNPGVSVAMPVHRADELLPPALDSILSQNGVDLEVLLILNGADNASAELVRAHAARDPRCRVIERPEANLAAALNQALRSARHALVARMDADDRSLPGRLAAQARAIEARPDIAALGSAYDMVDPSDRLIRTARPPTDPRDARWRLLIENEFCHGSMMLRREAVLAAGGYDESFTRAQDFELWTRLSSRLAVAAVPEVLYAWRLRVASSYSSSSDQASRAATILSSAWGALPEGDRDHTARLMSAAMDGKCSAADLRRALEESLRELPTRAALDAWHWSWRVFPETPNRALASMRRATIERALAGLRGDGPLSILLWGLDARSAWVLDHLRSMDVQVRGVISDEAYAEDLGSPVIDRHTLTPGDAVLLVDDWKQDQLWAASEPERARGVRVAKLFPSVEGR